MAVEQDIVASVQPEPGCTESICLGANAFSGEMKMNHVAKTHIADAPAALQDLLAEDFEQGVIALRTRLESEYAEVKRDRDELANQNEQLLALLESLTLTLDNAKMSRVNLQCGWRG